MPNTPSLIGLATALLLLAPAAGTACVQNWGYQGGAQGTYPMHSGLGGGGGAGAPESSHTALSGSGGSTGAQPSIPAATSPAAPQPADSGSSPSQTPATTTTTTQVDVTQRSSVQSDAAAAVAIHDHLGRAALLSGDALHVAAASVRPLATPSIALPRSTALKPAARVRRRLDLSGLAVALILGVAALVLILFRRPEEQGVPARSLRVNPHAGSAHEAKIEAELQELIAEHRAAQLLERREGARGP